MDEQSGDPDSGFCSATHQLQHLGQDQCGSPTTICWIPRFSDEPIVKSDLVGWWWGGLRRRGSDHAIILVRASNPSPSASFVWIPWCHIKVSGIRTELWHPFPHCAWTAGSSPNNFSLKPGQFLQTSFHSFLFFCCQPFVIHNLCFPRTYF